MQAINQILESNHIKHTEYQSDDYTDFYLERIQRSNASEGDLQGYNCPVCKNKGYTMTYDAVKKIEAMRMCSCKEIRKMQSDIGKSGLGNAVKEKTFETFDAVTQEQKNLKKVAQDYVNSDAWFFIGGNPGSGKTHICIAIMNEIFKKHTQAYYMQWREDVALLKKQDVDNEKDELFKKIKTCEVLYIDDFLKVQQGMLPTVADVNKAFEILNYRYNNNLRTIISTEFKMHQLLNIDNATASRIFEKTQRKYCLNVDNVQNYRTKDI